MGFTLRAALDCLPPAARVVVAELVPAVLEWNRGPLAALANRPLADPRVRIDEGDVALTMQASPGRFDAVLLDVDNGPVAMAASANARLYDYQGIAAAGASLRPGGVLAVWSSSDSRLFERRLSASGFRIQRERVRGRLERGGPRHTILLAHRDSALEP